MGVIINTVFAYWMWREANFMFENDRPTAGWICVAISAMNGAAVMISIF